MFEGYSGKRKTKEKLRSKENKNEHEAQSSGYQARALAPQNYLFGEASRGGRKDIFSLGSVECKEERRQLRKKETWCGLTQAEQRGSRNSHEELERQNQKRRDERGI